MMIYQLKKTISSPDFPRTLEAGRMFTSSQVKRLFPTIFYSSECNILKEWFDDVSDEYEFKNCEIIKKDKIMSETELNKKVLSLQDVRDYIGKCGGIEKNPKLLELYNELTLLAEGRIKS